VATEGGAGEHSRFGWLRRLRIVGASMLASAAGFGLFKSYQLKQKVEAARRQLEASGEKLTYL